MAETSGSASISTHTPHQEKVDLQGLQVATFFADDQQHTRLKALRRMLYHWHYHAAGFTMNVVEQSPRPTLPADIANLPFVRYVHITQEFNRSAARNIAIKWFGDQRGIFITDGDVLPSMAAVAAASKSSKVCAAYDHTVDLERLSITDRWWLAPYQELAAAPTIRKRTQESRNCGLFAATFIPAWVPDQVGYFDEEFTGWGAEDAEYLNRYLRLGGPVSVCGAPLYHVWHQPSEGASYDGDGSPIVNAQLFKQLNNLTDAQLRERHGIAHDG